MYEVELKVRADHEPVRERLKELGAEKAGRGRQVDTYYDAPGRSFAETDEALRVREEGDGATLTYKGPLVDETSKTRREAETGVEDADAMDEILKALGFEAAAEVRKRRERFAVDDLEVTLDSVDGLGEFVEVEGEAPEEDIPAVRERVRDLVGRLGLDPDEGIRTSYLELTLAEDEATN